MLCEIYPLTKSGFDIPTVDFSDDSTIRFYEKWEKLRALQINNAVTLLFERNRENISHCASRLFYFASICKENMDDFYITHGDAGGNFFVSDGHNYIIDWDEVMYSPIERDAWVMCCYDWARELFNNTLMKNHIQYQLRPERLAFYCYHMFFHYLCEFAEDSTLHDNSKRIEDYFDNGWIEQRIKFADTI